MQTRSSCCMAPPVIDTSHRSRVIEPTCSFEGAIPLVLIMWRENPESFLLTASEGFPAPNRAVYNPRQDVNLSTRSFRRAVPVHKVTPGAHGYPRGMISSPGGHGSGLRSRVSRNHRHLEKARHHAPTHDTSVRESEEQDGPGKAFIRATLTRSSPLRTRENPLMVRLVAGYLSGKDRPRSEVRVIRDNAKVRV